jgi:hypothetical protein
MYRIDDATAASSLPTPETAGTEGYFTEGNPVAGTPATNVRGSWLNMIQEELRALVVYGGLTPSKTVYTQVRDAIVAKFAKLNGDNTQVFSVAPATQSQHAVQMAQAAGVVGSVRNLKMYLSAASASATVTADEIIVETALGGVRYCLPSFSKTINLATTGAGGMDTGAAPVSGFVAIYAIYNPTTQTAALLATNASSLVANVYGGANMPSGYTASGLLAVVPTNASSQFKPVLVRDRRASFAISTALSTSTAASNITLSLAGIIPQNAIAVGGELGVVSTASSAMSLTVGADSNFSGQQNITGNPVTTANCNFSIPIVITQSLVYTASSSAGTPTFSIYLSSYDI